MILVGNDPASQVYVRNKQRSAISVGMDAIDYKFSSDDNSESVIKLIYQLNNDPLTHGILVQLPLPSNFDKDKIINSIDPLKDVDGLIIPGGESTTIVQLIDTYGFRNKIIDHVTDGMSIWGTCAGMIVLAKKLLDKRPSPLG